MKKLIITFCFLVFSAPYESFAVEGSVPKGVMPLNHVFVIVMENHSYNDIYNNPNAAFINAWAQSANLATNYYAVGHPSLTNYLEIVGGSNFGVRTDDHPDWHNATCLPNIAITPVGGDVCPITGSGSDSATGASDVDGIQSIPVATNVIGKTIADQLVEHGLRWKSYQESLPIEGAEFVTYSDGYFSVDTDFATIFPALTPPMLPVDFGYFPPLYAVKHNPFVYFKSVQEKQYLHSNLNENVAGFDGVNGFYADLAKGKMPNFAFIVPNQCHDEHGVGNAGPFCSEDEALVSASDSTVKKLVMAIKASRAWRTGKNAIVLVWDENDFSSVNQVMLLVDTNYGVHQLQSTNHYTHFSLLKSLESGFGLPCLNHACDNDVDVMTDLFGGKRGAGY